MTTINLSQIPRAEKKTIAQGLHQTPTDRLAHQGAEPGLDAFLPELADLTGRLSAHVLGQTGADAARITRLATADRADDAVDTWLRHIESFLAVEGHRRTGPHTALALALHDAALPDGLAHVDDRVVEENRHCRDALVVLNAPEHAPVLAGIGFPTSWLGQLEAALDASDAATNDVINARTTRGDHTQGGRDAEAEWIDLMVRLRRYVGSRAKRTDKAKLQEGRDLLRPLLEVVAKLRADSAARATRKKNDAAAPAVAPTPTPAVATIPATPAPQPPV